MNSFAIFGLGHGLSNAIFSCCSRALWLKLVFTCYNTKREFVAIYWIPSYTYAYKNMCLSLQAKLSNLLLILLVGVSLTLQKVTWCKFT